MYRKQNPEKVLDDMYGDLPEGFRSMCDHRKSYNRPLSMKRSEMGVIVCRVQKGEKEDLPGRLRRWGCSARIERGRAVKVGDGDHNLG
jgi:hypothetical protein